MDQVIRIAPENILSFGLLKGQIAANTSSAFFSGLIDEDFVRKCALIAAQYSQRPIGRVIVHQNNLVVTERLEQSRIQKVWQKFLGVVNWNTDRYFWFIHSYIHLFQDTI